MGTRVGKPTYHKPAGLLLRVKEFERPVELKPTTVTESDLMSITVNNRPRIINTVNVLNNAMYGNNFSHDHAGAVCFASNLG